MANTSKKRNLTKSDSENEISEFLRFIITETQEETPLVKLPHILDWKNNLQQSKHLDCEKIRNGNLLVQVDKTRRKDEKF